MGQVERTGSTCARSLKSVEGDHGGYDAGMSERVLEGADVDSALEKMGGEGMAHAVRCGRLRDGRLSHGILELTLHWCFMEMMAGDLAGTGMRAQGG